MTNPAYHELHQAAVQAAHEWAIQSYQKGAGQHGDIDGARSKFLAALDAALQPPPQAQGQAGQMVSDEPRLPYDVTVGGTTFRKGVRLSTFVLAAAHWHHEAFPDLYTLTDEQKAANLARLQGVWRDPDTGREVPKPEPVSVEAASALLSASSVQEGAAPKGIAAAPMDSYSAEDQAFYRFWYGHMLNDLMQPPLANISHATARYIWDAARAIAPPAAQPATSSEAAPTMEAQPLTDEQAHAIHSHPFVRDCLLRYVDRPCDPEATAVVRAIHNAANGLMLGAAAPAGESNERAASGQDEGNGNG